MQFMILFMRAPEKVATPIPADLREAEFDAVRRLYAEGSIRQIWLRGDAGGACAIMETLSPEDAAAKVNALPLVRAGVLQPPLIVPLKPYTGFGKSP
jgi:uncharacterized protein YciI